MNLLTPAQVNELLRGVPRNATVYLVGAGGCGMSGLGHLLLDLGLRVAGSDLAVNEEILQLRSRGAEIQMGHDAAQVRVAGPVLVAYTSAVRRGNTELKAAEQLRIPIVRRAILLAALLQRQRGICVAGMHGKTTTSALLAFALDQLGMRPSYAIGALVPQLQPHARFVECRGSAPVPAAEAATPVSAPELLQAGQATSQPPASEAGFFVAEADESDGTLREFHPEHAIVLNVDAEHLDYYANIEAVGREFQQFASQTRGHLVFCADDPRLSGLFARHPRAVSYGFHPLAMYRVELKPSVISHQRPAEDPKSSATALAAAGSTARPHASRFSFEGSRFALWRSGELLGEFTTSLLGEKNVSNAAGAIALLHQLGFAPQAIASAVAPFGGASRRQQELFSDDRFRVFDDYGHHPAEIRATLRALKTLGPRRLLVAFQPHRFTRTQNLLKEFATCFAEADRLWLAEVYAASEPAIPGVNGALLAEAVRGQGQQVDFVPALADLRRAVRAAMQPGDIVLFLGAGDITQAAHELAAQLREEIPALKDQAFAKLSERLARTTVLRRDEPLQKRTTLRVGGTADIYVEPASETELAEVLQFCAAHSLPFLTLGRGSNLLIKDGGIRGVVICLASPGFSRIEVHSDKLHCGAGAKLKAVAVEARRHGMTGLEFLEGIPGSVGGAMRMNAGAMGGWMFDVVERIRFMDFSGEVHEREAGEINVEYRGCPLFKTHIALGAVLKGQFASPEAIKERMDRFSKKRWDSQPSQPSAGCIFKNPKLLPAGKLIDELGLKGTRVGGAMVSDVHANFIINDGTATARDVLNLIEIIQQRAHSARGIELETEVEIVGENG